MLIRTLVLLCCPDFQHLTLLVYESDGHISWKWGKNAISALQKQYVNYFWNRKILDCYVFVTVFYNVTPNLVITSLRRYDT